MPTDHEIQERFDDLPAEVQAAIQSANMASALQSTGTAHGLHVDQLGALEDEALLVMLGFTNPAVFPERVRAAVGVDATTSALIAEELSQKLFMPIRVSMRSYMEERLQRAKQLKADASSVTTPIAPAAIAAPQPPTPRPMTESSSVIPASSGGKTIMPSSIQPVLHPADQMLAAAAVTMPGVTTFGAAPSLQASTRYSVDPYREPAE